MDRRFLGILAAIIIIFIGIFAITQNSNSNSSGNNGANNNKVTNHVEGQGSSGVTLQEWGDYQCPICEAYYQPLKQAVDQLKQQIHFQFSNLPLSPNPHPNAFAAARAAEAAGMQGKYWQMHDKLYENQNQWAGASNPQDFFNTYAQQIGLDVNKFKQDYASSQVNDAINADLAAFDKTGRDKATPTFFLNGKYIDNSQFSDPQTGAPSVAKITQVIQAEIDKKSGSSGSSSGSNSQPAASQPANTPSSSSPY
jgi:protein-disulfide isomerase